jgi:N-methylhydantoinase B
MVGTHASHDSIHPNPPDASFDSVALEILWARLIATADEAATALVRTSFSPILRESNDFACVILDAEGNEISENTGGIPSFNVTAARTLAHFLTIRPSEEWRPGDVGITNEPWLASGHLSDFTIVSPVFRHGRLIAWTGSVAHQADIGGALWSADTHEVYEEGLCLPPILLATEGELNDVVFEIIKSNVRLPEQVVGDVMAQMAAGRVAAERVKELLVDSGLEDLTSLSAEIRARSERKMREAISAVPDGVYRASLDLDGAGDEIIRLSVAVTVRGDTLEVDYQGTTAEVRMGLNTVANYTEAYTLYPIKCLLDPNTPRNAGSYLPITVHAPPGTILNPKRPAPVNGRQLVGHCLASVIYRALAPAVPERVIAESGAAPTLRAVISGPSNAEGSFTSVLFANGGMGARPTMDGLSTTCFPSNVVCGAMETIEATAPLRVWKKELIPNSGGAGRFRGGDGQEVEIEILAPGPCTLSLFVEHRENAAQGVFGGKPGSLASVSINGQTEGFSSKGRTTVYPGDRISIWYPGGGGYGHEMEGCGGTQS